MDATVLIATYGDTEWVDLAHRRAIPSAESQAPVIHRHGTSLAQARNEALALAQTKWVIHLDADDELEAGYVEAMNRGSADVRGPIARYIHGTQARIWQPRVHAHEHDCVAECLRDGNWLLVGAAVRTDLIRRAGGWHEYPWSEDWSTWIRCWKQGASFELIADAVYRAHVRSDSRNRGATQAEKLAAHETIYRDEFAA